MLFKGKLIYSRLVCSHGSRSGLAHDNKHLLEFDVVIGLHNCVMYGLDSPLTSMIYYNNFFHDGLELLVVRIYDPMPLGGSHIHLPGPSCAPATQIPAMIGGGGTKRFKEGGLSLRKSFFAGRDPVEIFL